MSIEKVKNYFKKFGLEDRIIEFDTSSATVELAAAALNCQSERIAKSLSFLLKEKAIIIVTAGDVKIDNKKFKRIFGRKAKMIEKDRVEELIGQGWPRSLSQGSRGHCGQASWQGRHPLRLQGSWRGVCNCKRRQRRQGQLAF